MPPRVSLIVVAAGRGARFGGAIPKQYMPCAGRPLLCHTLEAILAEQEYCAVTVVIHPDDRDLYETALKRISSEVAAKLAPPALGGATRQQSVRNGLQAQAETRPDIVLIHDGARPFPSQPLVSRAIEAARKYGAAIPGTPLTDTVKQIDAEGRIIASPERGNLRAVQTPQAFRFDLILEAHRNAERADMTDDAAVAEGAGHETFVFEGDPANGKVTTMKDLHEAEARLTSRATEVRVGQGFDVHAFAVGDGVWLGGVRIPFDRKLEGHSDADVALHAIADAIYGALGEGDIGAHFPPSEPRWRGADSSIFLAHAAERVRARGGAIAHIDTTLICEAPKIGPYREAIRARIAAIACINIARTGLKATTSEGLGFIGRREGIACLATATIRLPPE